MALAGCRTIDVQVDIIYYNMIISYIQYITSHCWPYHITSHTLQKQVRRSLILLLHVLRGDHGYLVGSHLTYANTTTEIYELLFNLIQGPPRSNPIQLKLEKLTLASHL